MAASTPRTRPCRPIERRPPMLKDFLLRDDGNSCSSSGFKSFPLHDRSAREAPAGLQRSRSRSRAAADATISAFHKLLNAVRSLPLPAVKSPSKKKTKITETAVQVTVKDILRWKSFRDLIDGQEDPDLCPGSDGRPGSTCSVGGKFGFTAEELGENGNVGGDNLMRTGTATGVCSDMGPAKKQELAPMDDDDEQHSPVSVLDSPFRDDEEAVSSFDQTRARLLERIKWFEDLAGVDEQFLDEEEDTDHLVHESAEEEEEDYESINVDGLVFDMEKEARWSKFEEQQTQLGLELEIGMLNSLLDELLFELVGNGIV